MLQVLFCTISQTTKRKNFESLSDHPFCPEKNNYTTLGAYVRNALGCCFWWIAICTVTLSFPLRQMKIQ